MKEEPIDIVRVGKDEYMTLEDANRLRRSVWLEPPIEGEPFMTAQNVINLLSIIIASGAGWLAVQIIKVITGW